MDIETYLDRRRHLAEAEPKLRQICIRCLQPSFGCYCQGVAPIDCKIEFVILIHRVEVRRRIATGRMSHLLLKHSHLIMGHNFTHCERANSLIEDATFQNLVLYPGKNSYDISHCPKEQLTQIIDPTKPLRIFVIDGTWGTARTMMNQSENLKRLPRICFTPTRPSNFRVRKQPKELCVSTIEAIHHTIDLLGETKGFDTHSRKHDVLLHKFDEMVEKQLAYMGSNRHYRSRELKKMSKV